MVICQMLIELSCICKKSTELIIVFLPFDVPLIALLINLHETN